MADLPAVFPSPAPGPLVSDRGVALQGSPRRGISPLNRARWIRRIARSQAKLIRDRATLMTATHGVPLPPDEKLLEIIEANAVVSLIYAAELRRRLPKFSDCQKDLPLP